MGCHTWFYANQKNFEKQLDCEYHDIFRHDDIDADDITSGEDMIIFILNNNISLNDKQIKDLERFWNKYPDGIIEFG